MDKHIETLDMMEAAYAHIRKNDDQYEAIEAAISALQEQAEREKGCEYCSDYEPNYNQFYDSEGELGAKFIFCPMCGRRLK